MQRNFRAAARLIDARWMPRSAAWAWRDLPSARFAIAFSLFLALLAAAFLVGDHVVFDTLQFAVAPQEEQTHVGQIFYSLPDKSYCRHMSFDNATSQLVAGNVAACPSRDPSGRHQTEFAWGRAH
jgi:hypothetical protein